MTTVWSPVKPRKGTTHNTNGIIIQRDTGQQLEPSTSMCRDRKRTIEAPAEPAMHYQGQKRRGPIQFQGENLDLSRCPEVHTESIVRDRAYFLAKYCQTDGYLPGWTGWNQVLHKDSHPINNVGYLPIIDSSPTDKATVLTILEKRLEIAYALNLQSIVLVMDQANYAKAQEIRWKQFNKMPAIKLKKVTAEYLAEKEKAAEKEKEKSKKSLEEVAEGEDEEEEVKPYNFLDVEVLWDKRKRTLPAPEQKLIEWLDANLVSKPDVYLPLLTLYEYYSEVCQMQGSQVVDVPVFNRYIKDKFGKFFGFQENSPYRVLIKERKPKEKKPKVEGESGQLKMRDIIREVIETAGNPRKGLRFSVISKSIMQKYPAHKIGMTPKKLKTALERGVYFGHLKLVRGVGMLGYYRLPGEPTIEEEDTKKPKTEEKTEDGEEKKESTENGVEESEGGEPTTQGTKRKTEGEESAEESPKKKQKKKTTKKKKKPVEKVYRSEASKHSDPQRVEDAFPMAITYQSDPKECSTAKIRNYISKYYHVDVNQEKLKKALEAGVEKGLWEVTKGNGIHGTYHLLIETFNPARSDNLMDQIAQALVACHEPKCASVGLIKKYITQYHPKLNIDIRPHLFKSALERAINKGLIRQLTGCGASGSFQLVYQFFPSPAILAGEDADDEEDEEEQDDSDEDDVAVEYVPRPTKRGRMAQRKPQTSAASTSKSRGRFVSTDSKKGKATKGKGKPAPKPAKKGRKAVVVDDSEEEDEDVEVEEYTPRKSKSRGGGSAVKVSQSGKKAPAKPATPAKKGKAPAKQSKPVKNSPQKSASKGRGTTPAKRSAPPSPQKTSPKKSTPKKIVVDDSDEEPISDQEEYVPKPSKRRGGAAEPQQTKSETKKSSSKSRRR